MPLFYPYVRRLTDELRRFTEECAARERAVSRFSARLGAAQGFPDDQAIAELRGIAVEVTHPEMAEDLVEALDRCALAGNTTDGRDSAAARLRSAAAHVQASADEHARDLAADLAFAEDVLLPGADRLDVALSTVYDEATVDAASLALARLAGWLHITIGPDGVLPRRGGPWTDWLPTDEATQLTSDLRDESARLLRLCVKYSLAARGDE